MRISALVLRWHIFVLEIGFTVPFKRCTDSLRFFFSCKTDEHFCFFSYLTLHACPCRILDREFNAQKHEITSGLLCISLPFCFLLWLNSKKKSWNCLKRIVQHCQDLKNIKGKRQKTDFLFISNLSYATKFVFFLSLFLIFAASIV